MNYLPSVFHVAAAVILIAATFLLHRRLGSSSSLFLLVAVILLSIYASLAPAILIFFRETERIDDFWFWHRVARPVLHLLIALSFLRVVLVDLRPKATPKKSP